MPHDELREFDRREDDRTTRQIVEELWDKVSKHIEDEPKTFSAYFNQAFPGGDADGHRRFHEAMIEAERERAKFYRELRLEIAKKGLWFLLVVIAGLIAVGVSQKLGIGRLP